MLINQFICIISEISFRSIIIVLLILISKKIFTQILTKQTHYLIWFILILSLITPITPRSYISIYNIIPSIETSISYDLIDDISPFIINLNQNTKHDIDITYSFNHFLFLIWFIGFISFFIFTTYIQVKFYLKIKIENDIDNPQIRTIFENVKRNLNINDNIILKKSKNINVPCLFWFKNPYIIIPQNLIGSIENDQLEMIITHELCHYKRCDHIINLIIILLQSFYWFNPFVWIGFSSMKHDIEIACDELVISNLDTQKRLFYGRTIIELLEICSKARTIEASMNIIKNKIEIKRRITMIKNHKKDSKKNILIGFLLVVFIASISMFAPINKAEAVLIEPSRALEFSLENYDKIKSEIDSNNSVKVNLPMDFKYDDPYSQPPIHIDLKKGEQVLESTEAKYLLRFLKK